MTAGRIACGGDQPSIFIIAHDSRLDNGQKRKSDVRFYKEFGGRMPLPHGCRDDKADVSVDLSCDMPPETSDNRLLISSAS